MATVTDGVPPGTAPSRAGSVAHRRWVLGMLLAVATFNTLDRGAIGIVQEPMRKDLGLTDLQLGLLGGPAFALLFFFVSIPLARMADRRARVPLIAVCLGVWSIATALCGAAANFTGLVLCRFGISVGEAGSGPASQSLIVDYYPPEARATALSVLGVSTPLASLVGGLAGGWLAQNFGWRLTFVALGLPGLAIAALLLLTVKEPARSSGSRTRGIPGAKDETLGQVLRALLAQPTVVIMVASVSLACFAGYAVHQYFISFLMRNHGLSLAQGASFGALVYGVCAAAGTLAGGYLTDRGQARFPRIAVWLPATGLMVAGPCYMAGYLTTSLPFMVVLVMVGAFANYLYVGVMFAVLYELVPASMRSTSAALLMLAITLFGYGLGPPSLGLLSDTLAAARLSADGLSVHACLAAAGSAVARCEQARAAGLGQAIVTIQGCYFWAGVIYMFALVTLPRDRAAAERRSESGLSDL